MKVKVASPVANLSGTVQNSDLVYIKAGDETHARSKVKPFDPQTAPQILSRLKPELARDLWEMLTPAQYRAWEAYLPIYRSAGHQALRGLDVFKSVAFRRGFNGLDPRLDAPLYPPPPALSEATLVPVTSPDRLAFTVSHNLGTNPEGIRMTVKITPPSQRRGRKPNRNNLVLICSNAPSSTIVLPADGEVAEFGAETASGPLRFKIAPNQRFGMEIVLWRESEGVASAAWYGDMFTE